jgi:hypothetical protein
MTAPDAPGEVLAEQTRYCAARAPEYEDWWFRRGRYRGDPGRERRSLHDVAELDERLRRFAPRGDVLERAAGTVLDALEPGGRVCLSAGAAR